MKKAVFIFLSLIMVITLIVAGCSEEAAPATVTETSPATVTETAPATEPATAEEVYKFRLSSHFPESQTADWVNSVHEASGGRIQIDVFALYSLLSLEDTLTGLKDGIADIAIVPCETFPEAYPLNHILTMPFLPLGDKRQQYEIWHELQDEFPELTMEWSDFQVLFDDTGEANTLHMVNASIIAPEDMDGMRVFAGSITGDIMEDLGATPLFLEGQDWFTSLDRGLLDGMWLPWDATYDSGIYSLVPYHTSFTGATGMLMKNMLMRNEAWNSLPADLQKILLELGPPEREREWQALNAKVDSVKESILAEGGTINELNSEQVAKWYEVAKPHHETYLAKIDAMGLPATEIYNEALKLAQEY